MRALYGSESWMLNARESKRVYVLEKMCFGATYGVRWFDMVRNGRERKMCGDRKILNERVEQHQLKWFGHVEKMWEERTVRELISQR